MFKFHSAEKYPNFPVLTYLPVTSAETYADGELLAVTSGKLTKAGADTDATTKVPEYIAHGATIVDGKLPCYKITPDMLFSVPMYAASGTVSATEGTKLTIHTDGLQVTATTTKGLAKVVKGCSSAAIGTEILVRFE